MSLDMTTLSNLIPNLVDTCDQNLKKIIFYVLICIEEKTRLFFLTILRFLFLIGTYLAIPE